MPQSITTVTISSTATGTRISTDAAPWDSVTVIARPTNSSAVYIGTASVTSTAGIMLQPGDQFEFKTPPRGQNISLSTLFVIADVANDRIDYFAYSE